MLISLSRCTVPCLQLGLPVVDAWAAMEGATNTRGDYLSDGLHLNARYTAPTGPLLRLWIFAFLDDPELLSNVYWLFSSDVHLAVCRGNEALFNAARQVVLQWYPELNPEALPMHMLEWSRMIERDRVIARAAFQLGK